MKFVKPNREIYTKAEFERAIMARRKSGASKRFGVREFLRILRRLKG